jgi:hypothetical protein
MKDLAILICHTPDRYDFMKRLTGILDPQLEKHKNNVICLSDDSRYKSIGKKRNDLVARANAKYYCFIDDDDRVSTNYIDLLMQGIHKGVDCCSLTGVITWDGQNPKPFIHSLQYTSYWEDDKAFYRYPNHLNCVKTEIGRWFRFPEKNHGEDTDYATQMFKAGVLKTEHEIKQTIYYYDYRTKK